MADFNTHIVSAAALSSLAATWCVKVLDIGPGDALWLTLAGTLGGILPDIDLQRSVPSKWLFNLLGGVLALLTIYRLLPDYTALETWLLAAAVFLLVRLPLWWCVHRFTVHRGSAHSLLAACTCMLIVAALSHHAFARPAGLSWWLALFAGGGFVLHLTLDEIYSVDFTGARFKRSFGSALKLVDTRYWIPTTSMVAACVALLAFLPDSSAWVSDLGRFGDNWQTALWPSMSIQK